MILHTLLRSVSAVWGDTSGLLLRALALLAGVSLLVLLVVAGQVRLAFALVVIWILLGLARVDVRVSILATFAFLTILGDLRRWIIPAEAWSGADPLLMVGAVIAVGLWITALASKQVRFDTTLSRWMLILMAIMVIHVFNPAQGNLMVGISGAIFLLTPLLWYWVGKAYGSEAFLETLFFRVIVPLAVLASLFGFYQVFYGYPEYQLVWYRGIAESYVALGDSEDTLRPLSFFPNIAEYTHYLGLALIALIALVLRKRASLGTFALILLIFTAMFLTGTRGPIVKVLFAAAVLWTILGKNKAVWLPRLVIAVAIAGLGLVFGLSSVGQMEMDDRVSSSVQRQAALMPDDSRGSGTVGIHLNLVRIAFFRASQQPLGYGLGYTTMGADRFGGGGWSSEKDFTDMFLTLGIPGGIVYLIVMGLCVLLAIRHWARSRSVAAMTVLGLLIFMTMGWLMSGSYVVTPLVWFSIGMMDSIAHQDDAGNS